MTETKDSATIAREAGLRIEQYLTVGKAVADEVLAAERAKPLNLPRVPARIDQVHSLALLFEEAKVRGDYRYFAQQMIDNNAVVVRKTIKRDGTGLSVTD